MALSEARGVLTLGTFDLLHVGHLNLLRHCREIAGSGVVTVAVNTDEFIERYKGRPPVMTLEERMTLVGALYVVDEVLPNDQPDGSAKDVIEAAHPDVIVVGDDWADRDYLGQSAWTRLALPTQLPGRVRALYARHLLDAAPGAAVIPAVVIPAINRFDSLEANLGAFDHPMARLVIIDNSLTGYTYAPPAGSPFKLIEHLRPILPLGVTGGFNAGISQTPEAEWWLRALQRTSAMAPGDLSEIERLISNIEGPAVVTGSRDDMRLLRSAYMAVNRACIETVGLYDEWAFFPCYFEDDDYVRRCELAGVQWLVHDGAISHDRSVTIRSDERMAQRNSETFPDNLRRYVAKWGGAPGREQFKTPYDIPNCPLSFMQPDPAGRAKRAW